MSLVQQENNLSYRYLIHVKVLKNNFFFTVTDAQGNVLHRQSYGIAGFRGPSQKSPLARNIVILRFMKYLSQIQATRQEKTAVIFFKGPVRERAELLPKLRRRLTIVGLYETTPLPHNGCRLPKERRTGESYVAAKRYRRRVKKVKTVVRQTAKKNG